MKEIVWVLFFGLAVMANSHSIWAFEVSEEEVKIQQEQLPETGENEETSSEKFAELVESTMDLMGPELEAKASSTSHQ